ncbi:MAG TPA: BamA/TamA family outer membrane protein [Bacteroidia bacterium]
MINGYKILKKQTLLFSVACLAVFLFSCKTTHKLNKGEYLLDENKILNNKTEVATDDISPFIRQQPNRYLVNINALNVKWFPYYLWLYNSINRTKMQQVKVARDAKYDTINVHRTLKNTAKNEKRKAKGKKPIPLKLKDKSELTWRESWVQNGEPPAILDSSQIKLSEEQIKKFLLTKGYFLAKVKDSVVLAKNKKKATVCYKLDAGAPYQIKNIKYVVEDPTLEYFIMQDTVHSLIQRGLRYDVDILTKERDRISKQQRNEGYFKFGPEFVFFLVDTNLAGDYVNIEVDIKRLAYHPDTKPDTTLFTNHIRYHINNIFIVTDYDIFNRNKQYSDTANYDDLTFLYNKKLLFRMKDINSKIFFYKGELFNNDRVEETYTRLTSMKAFKSVNINFKEDGKKKDYINSYILMSPAYKQNFSIATDGTNTSGNLGIEASIVYQNRNIFKGSELLEIKLKGGLIAQKNFNVENTANSAFDIPFLRAFNTVQFGPEVNLNFPKPLFPFTLLHFSSQAAPKTIVSSSYNFQQNSLYSRALTSISYGLQYNGRKYIRHSIVPVEVNLIKAYLSSPFQHQLDKDNNLFLSTSFKSHMTTVSRYTFMYNNQLNTQASQYKTFSYFKVDLESSGNILRGLYNATSKPNALGQYEIFGMPFAQFLRFDADYRVYKTVRKLGRFVYRVYGGMGYALKNLSAIPYEKSFYGGGPNDIRAWQARSLGEGGYNQKGDNSYDKIGDIQMEMNFEYRFKIYKWINGAYFVDAGNVWMRQKQDSRPLADFALNRFYKEVAVGTGLGLRADFSFFIVRLDGALKVVDPKNPEGKRFVLWGDSERPYGFGGLFNLNFGIGYPF